jgi:arylsulfatase A-like enzyme
MPSSLPRVVTVICDSLRRDLLSEQNTPTLWRLRRASTYYADARAVFPSTTRTSSASIATGCQPARHGLSGNCVVLAEDGGLVTRNVGVPTFRDHLRAVTGRTLRVPVLAERVRPLGQAFIMSNVSAGAAYFHDPDGHGEVYHRAGSYGHGGAALTPDPMRGLAVGAVGDAGMTELFCARLAGDAGVVAATLWLSEPDHSGHLHALGSPAHLAGIAAADRCVAQVLDAVAALRAQGEEILLIVASDHGMQTIVEAVPVVDHMVAAGFKDHAGSREVAVAPNGTAFTVGIADGVAHRSAPLAAWLREQPWAGAVYTGAALAGLGLADTPECRIAVTLREDESPNAHGVPGGSCYIKDPDEPGDYFDRGQHGGLGRYEQSPFLMINGQGFAAGATVSEPARLIDLAPTALRHLGLAAQGCDGRALQTAQAAPLARASSTLSPTLITD